MLEIIIDYQFSYEKVGKSYRIIELVQLSPNRFKFLIPYFLSSIRRQKSLLLE